MYYVFRFIRTIIWHIYYKSFKNTRTFAIFIFFVSEICWTEQCSTALYSSELLCWTVYRVCISLIPYLITEWRQAKLIHVSLLSDTYFLTYSMQQSPSWEANRFSESRNSPRFMEPEGSLPHSQVPATYPYPGPARSSPCPHIQLPIDLS